MLTMLKVEDRPESFWRKKYFRRLPVNVMRLETVESEDLSLRKITYINRNGRIAFDRLRRLSEECKGEILYGGKGLPEIEKLSFFDPSEYLGRICVNLALICLQLLSKESKGLKVGFYDPKGEFSDVAERLAILSKELVVLTENIRLYEEESRRLLWERGMPLTISRRWGSLRDCALVVAPIPLEDEISLNPKAVLLTCKKPKFSPSCKVYHRYSIKLPQKYVKEAQFLGDDTLFAAGLYSLCRDYTLGSLVPLVCSGENGAQTYLSLCKYLM